MNSVDASHYGLIDTRVTNWKRKALVGFFISLTICLIGLIWIPTPYDFIAYHELAFYDRMKLYWIDDYTAFCFGLFVVFAFTTNFLSFKKNKGAYLITFLYFIVGNGLFIYLLVQNHDGANDNTTSWTQIVAFRFGCDSVFDCDFFFKYFYLILSFELPFLSPVGCSLVLLFYFVIQRAYRRHCHCVYPKEDNENIRKIEILSDKIAVTLWYIGLWFCWAVFGAFLTLLTDVNNNIYQNHWFEWYSSFLGLTIVSHWVLGWICIRLDKKRRILHEKLVDNNDENDENETRNFLKIQVIFIRLNNLIYFILLREYTVFSLVMQQNPYKYFLITMLLHFGSDFFYFVDVRSDLKSTTFRDSLDYVASQYRCCCCKDSDCSWFGLCFGKIIDCFTHGKNAIASEIIIVERFEMAIFSSIWLIVQIQTLSKDYYGLTQYQLYLTWIYVAIIATVDLIMFWLRNLKYYHTNKTPLYAAYFAFWKQQSCCCGISLRLVVILVTAMYASIING